MKQTVKKGLRIVSGHFPEQEALKLQLYRSYALLAVGECRRYIPLRYAMRGPVAAYQEVCVSPSTV